MGNGDDAGELKFGLSLRRQAQDQSKPPRRYSRPTARSHLAPYTYGAGQIYYNNLYDIGPAINLPAVRTLATGNLGTITDDAAADASGSTDDKENVYAGYGEYSARSARWGCWQGRAWSPRTATLGGDLLDGDLDTNTPSTARNSYTNFFSDIAGAL